MKSLLSVKNLSVQFKTQNGLLKAVNGVDLDILPKSTLGLVGESGCGKTVICLSIVKLIEPPGEITGGSVMFEDKNLLNMTESELREIRGNKISFVFQEPMTSLNPVLTIGEQIAEALLAHHKVSRREALSESVRLLEKVKMPLADKIIYEYPHNLSGGMRQRVMIAMALAGRPKLFIADEPTTALDVTIQAQILNLLENLQEEFGMSILIVTHDFGVAARLADFAAVMYAGEIVEYSSVKRIFNNPKHPYTKGLLEALPQTAKRNRLNRLKEIPGVLPDLTLSKKGCLFYSRCVERNSKCLEDEPVLKQAEEGHYVRCSKRHG